MNEIEWVQTHLRLLTPEQIRTWIRCEIGSLGTREHEVMKLLPHSPKIISATYAQERAVWQLRFAMLNVHCELNPEVGAEQ